MKIKELFTADRDIYRTIEKVITFAANRESQLDAEISEYVLTESLEDELERLLTSMQRAMDEGSGHEVGVWISGFYGSGKSSFAKYLGLALDDSIKVGGVTFLELLQNRCRRTTTKQLLKTVATRFPAAVVFVDLSSESLAGATMDEVSQTLFYKVLQRAGYSKNRKIAQFEHYCQSEGRFDELKTLMEADTGIPYATLQSQTIIHQAKIPAAAHQMFPDIWKNASAFDTDSSDEIRFDDDVAKEMIEILRTATGKENLLFICDEAGQYVAARGDLILDLQGLAQNFKRLGDGKVWLLATGQQTLTEDDAQAQLNSPELFKLKDRFPISITLQANDIQEICYRRLLEKSPEGESQLETLFKQHGPRLQSHAKLRDAGKLSGEFTQEQFLHLYPFLPAHFGILLNLLSQLAKKSGGIGLRSAIRVIQEVLVRPDAGEPAVEREIGWLATADTIFDAMRKDIETSFSDLFHAYTTLEDRYETKPLAIRAAKCALVLQILKAMPATPDNIAALLQDELGQVTTEDQVVAALNEIAQDDFVPFGLRDGQYAYLSEKLAQLEEERRNILVRQGDVERAISEFGVTAALDGLPKIRIADTKMASIGVKRRIGGDDQTLDGDTHDIQLVVQLATPSEYDATRASLIRESLESTRTTTAFIIGREPRELRSLATNICQCREISRRYQGKAEAEVRDYVLDQQRQAQRDEAELRRIVIQALLDGSLIFRGKHEASNILSDELTDAIQKFMKDAGQAIFDQYDLADARVETKVAEQFLKTKLEGITRDIDPLGIVHKPGGEFDINRNHPALLKLKSFIEVRNSVDGRTILNQFSKPPFGWHADTIRYLVAALFRSGEVSIRTSGVLVTTVNDLAIKSINSKPNFTKCQIEIRSDRVDQKSLGRAAKRLQELTGRACPPIEDRVCAGATEFFTGELPDLATLATTLEGLEVGGRDDLQSLIQRIDTLMTSGGAEVPAELGAEESSLFDLYQQARATRTALEQDPTLPETVSWLRATWSTVADLLPDKHVTDLRDTTEASKNRILPLLEQAEFFKNHAAFADERSTLQQQIAETARTLDEALTTSIQDAKHSVAHAPGWDSVDLAIRNGYLQELDALKMPIEETAQGLKMAGTQQYRVRTKAEDIRGHIERHAADARKRRLEDDRRKAEKEGREKIARRVEIPRNLQEPNALRALITTLQELERELREDAEIEITLAIQEEADRGV